MRLTDAQEGFLWLLNSEPTPADPHYKPARRSGRLSFYWVFTITPAGRLALKDTPHDQ